MENLAEQHHLEELPTTAPGVMTVIVSEANGDGTATQICCYVNIPPNLTDKDDRIVFALAKVSEHYPIEHAQETG